MEQLQVSATSRFFLCSLAKSAGSASAIALWKYQLVSIHSNSLFDISHIQISISSFPAVVERCHSFGDWFVRCRLKNLLVDHLIGPHLRLFVDLWLSYWPIELSSLREICFRVINSYMALELPSHYMVHFDQSAETFLKVTYSILVS